MDWVVALGFVVAILLVVMIHEAGHFFTAKAFGIKVEQFFVGFGPRLWSVRRGETEYGIKALPLGGYVRIAGMNPYQEIAQQDVPRTFGAKPAWQRAVVIGMGPFTHFVLALILLAVFYSTVGLPNERRPLIGAVETQIVAVDGLPGVVGPMPGDLIRSVDGRSLATFATEEAFLSFVGALGTGPVPLTVLRGQQEVDYVQAVLTVIASPASQVGIRPGDELLRVNGTSVGSIDEFIQTTRGHLGEPIEVTFARDGLERTVRATPVLSTAGGFVAPRLGVGLDGVPERVGVARAIGRGVIQTGVVAKAVVLQMGDVFGPTGARRIWQLLTGAEERTPDDVVSVVGAVRLATQAAQAGAWERLLELMIVLNVFVGILNLVPLPPFDGGHLAVLAIEKVFRRRVDPRRLVPVTAVVAGYMILFALSVVFLDFVDPVPNPFP